MKWLISILALLVLFALSVPVMGAESAPPGEIAIELSADIGPFDPVPAVDKMSVFFDAVPGRDLSFCQHRPIPASRPDGRP